MEELLSILRDLRDDVDYAGGARLIDDGVLDSFDVVSLIGELNERYGIYIGMEHLTAENFNSATSILALITRMKASDSF
jgi:acyl carrier protein